MTINRAFETYMDTRNRIAESRERRLAEMAATLEQIADIAEGSGTVNSLQHIAKIARAALSSGMRGENDAASY